MPKTARKSDESIDAIHVDEPSRSVERFKAFDANLNREVVMAHASPARLLQDGILSALEHTSAPHKKIPIKWTILGLTLFCGSCWYAVIQAFL